MKDFLHPGSDRHVEFKHYLQQSLSSDNHESIQKRAEECCALLISRMGNYKHGVSEDTTTNTLIDLYQRFARISDPAVYDMVDTKLYTECVSYYKKLERLPRDIMQTLTQQHVVRDQPRYTIIDLTYYTCVVADQGDSKSIVAFPKDASFDGDPLLIYQIALTDDEVMRHVISHDVGICDQVFWEVLSMYLYLAYRTQRTIY